METFKVNYNRNKHKGTYAISLVNSPAMEGEFVRLSTQKVEFKTQNEEKRLLTGLALEPNKLIYRNNNGKEYNIFFTADVIEQLSHDFYINNNHKNSTIEHQGSQIEGVTFVESWIIEDPKLDKSTALGLSYPKGSWMVTMKVENYEIWNDYVKTGRVLGFSIDAFLDLEKVELNTNNEMSNFKEELRKFLGLSEEVKVTLGSVKTAEGVVLMFEGDELTANSAIWVEAENGEKVAVPVGEHKLEDGRLLVVEEEGRFARFAEAVVEQEQELTEVPEVPQLTPEETQKIKSMLIKFSEFEANFINELDTKLSAIEQRIKDIEATPAEEVVALTKPTIKEPKTKVERFFNTINEVK